MSEFSDAWGTGGYVLLRQVFENAEVLFERFERYGRQADLVEAARGFSAVLEVAQNVDLRSAATNGMGLTRWSRYEVQGDPADLDAAIDLFRAAVAMYPNESAALVTSYRSNLAGTLNLRWRRTRSAEDMSEAIKLAHVVVDATPQSHSRYSTRVNGLAGMLTAKHIDSGDSSALAEAIQLYREAVRYGAPRSDGLRWARSNLAEALRMRYVADSGRDPSVLDEAVEQARMVLAEAPRDRLYPRFQSNLAIILVSRFHARHHRADLAEAAELSQAAVKATPAGQPDLAERLSILTGIRQLQLVQVAGPRLSGRQPTALFEDAFEAGFEAAFGDGRLSDRTRRPARRRRRDRRPRAERAAEDRVIRSSGEMIATVPEGHILHAGALVLRGSVLAQRAVGDDDPARLAESIDCFRRVAQNPAAPASSRVRAGWYRAIAELVASGGAITGASMEPFELAVNLLPQTAPRSVTHADRERGLAGFAGLACDAAACAIRLGRPELALQLLEHGRGVLLSRALETRTELTELRKLRPDLASRFVALRSALDAPEGHGFSIGQAEGGRTPSAKLLGRERHSLAREWDQLLDTIRRVDGFAGFLQPPPIGDVLATASGLGPVAVLNVSALHCDAILITEGRVKFLGLIGLSASEVAERADRYRAAMAGVRNPGVPAELRESARQAVHETLAWLWRAVAEPVLDALRLLRPVAEDGDRERPLPRLWWIPTGALTMLPLHAAGLDDVPGACVLDHVISSYAPTVRSLTSAPQHTARRPARRRAPHSSELLIVAVPSAPGFPDLPGVREEIAVLSRRYPGSRILTGEQASRQAVLGALPRHPRAHFACHAVSPADGVATGRLILHDHASDPLTVADIARLHLDGAEIAFLSACDTGVARQALADEALHITGAFHMAGYRHVIGTLWRVDDAWAPIVAESFHSALDGADPDRRDAPTVASALHAAIHMMRRRRPDSPELWAAYVHVGP